MFFTEEKELEKMRAELLAPRIKFCRRYESVRDSWEDAESFEWSDYYDFHAVEYGISLDEIELINQMDDDQIREYYNYEFNKEHPVHPYVEDLFESLNDLTKTISEMNYNQIEELFRTFDAGIDGIIDTIDAIVSSKN